MVENDIKGILTLPLACSLEQLIKKPVCLCVCVCNSKISEYQQRQSRGGQCNLLGGYVGLTRQAYSSIYTQ